MKRCVYLLILFLCAVCPAVHIKPEPYIGYNSFTSGVYTLDTAGITLTAGTLIADTLAATGLTAGSVVFSDGTNLAEDNSNLCWDDTNNRLGVGTNTGFDPCVGLTVFGDIDILHTAIMADDHAFEIDVNAAGYGDVKAIDIDYITGAISKGKDEGVILINIDEILATGGDVFGLEVLATEGSAGIYGMKVGAVIGPIHQGSGTFANPTTATNNTISTDVPDMNDGNSVTTTAIFEDFNEYILIGAAAAFEEIEFIITTGSSGGGIKPTFWYSTAGSHTFTQFTPVDGTNGFRNTGVVAWDANDLSSHGINTDTSTYDIKVIRTRNSLTTSPILGFAKTAATTEYLWDKNGDINIRNLTASSTLTAEQITSTANMRVIGTLTAGTLTDGSAWMSGGAISATHVHVSGFLQLRDPTSGYKLKINAESGVSGADRELDIRVGAAGRTLTLSGDPTLADWFDQDVKTTAAPGFATGVTIGNLTLANGSITDSSNAIDFGNEALSTSGLVQGGTFTNDTTNHNLIIGYNAAAGITATADYTLALGEAGAGANGAGMSGEKNSVFGFESGRDATTASANVGIGYRSLWSLTEGIGNFGLGTLTLQYVTDGDYNVALGDGTGRYLTGSYNMAIGRGSQTGSSGNSTGTSNTSIGDATMNTVTTGVDNTAIGRNALAALTTGNSNTAIGRNALDSLQTRTGNVAIGRDALEAGTALDYTTAVGYRAGRYNNADRNVFLGAQAGYDETGANTFIIDNADRTSEALGRSRALLYGLFYDHASGPALYTSGDFHVPNMKTGTTQVNAGAATGELWADSDDDYTVKLGQ